MRLPHTPPLKPPTTCYGPFLQQDAPKPGRPAPPRQPALHLSPRPSHTFHRSASNRASPAAMPHTRTQGRAQRTKRNPPRCNTARQGAARVGTASHVAAVRSAGAVSRTGAANAGVRLFRSMELHVQGPTRRVFICPRRAGALLAHRPTPPILGRYKPC